MYGTILQSYNENVMITIRCLPLLDILVLLKRAVWDANKDKLFTFEGGRASSEARS